MENKKIRVAHFIDSFYPQIDGVVSVVNSYANILNQRDDAEVFVAAPLKGHSNEGIEYNVYRCRTIKFKNRPYGVPLPAFDRKFKVNLKEQGVDIVHIHSPAPIGWAGLKLAKKLDVPCVATLHTIIEPAIKKLVKSQTITNIAMKNVIKTYEKCDETFIMSKMLEENFRESGFKGKARIMPSGTDMDYSEDPEKSRNVVNRRFRLKDDENVCLFVGRIELHKRIFFIAKSIKIAKEKGLKVKMIFVGDGPEFKQLKKLVHKLGIQKEVIFAGRIMNRKLLSDIYLRSDLFLFPPIHEADGLVVKEARANKTPSLFVKGSIPGHLFEPDKTGFFADNTEEAYANKIVELFNNKQLIKTVGENCYNQTHLTWEKSVDRAFEAYKEIIENHKNKEKVVKRRRKRTSA